MNMNKKVGKSILHHDPGTIGIGRNLIPEEVILWVMD